MFLGKGHPRQREGAGVGVRVVMQRDESVSVLCIWETGNSL